MITAHLTIQPRITAIRVRSWEAAKIQSSCRTVVERLSRPAIQQMTATTASTITVQRLMSCEKKTTTDSMAAIQSETRTRFASSHRPARDDPWSTIPWESLLNTRSTVPRRWRDPGLRAASKCPRSRLRVRPVMEEPVDGRTGAADVCAERTERLQLVDERRAREVVQRQGREVARPPDVVEHREQLCAPLLEALGAVAAVEAGVDARRRLLHGAVCEHEEHPEVLRDVHRCERRSVSRSELHALVEEEGHVGTDPAAQVVEGAPRERLVERVVRKAQRGRGVRASAGEPGGERDPLLDAHAPACAFAGFVRECVQRLAHDGVAVEPFDARGRSPLEVEAIVQADALVHGHDLVLAVLPQGPDDEGEVDLRRRRCSHSSASASATNSRGASDSARAVGSRPIAASAAAARSRGARPARAREFGSVLRRCANEAATTRFTRAKSFGIATRLNATSAELTFGGGRKTARDTGWKPTRSQTS